MRPFPSINILLAMVLLVAGCSREKRQDNQLEKLSTRIKWLPGITYVGSYLAREKGYWEKQGLDVSVLPGGFEADPIKLVAANSDQFGITGSEQLLQARTQGLPLVAIYMELSLSPAGWMAKATTGIRTPHDFVGHKIGAQYGTNIEPTLDALLGKLRIDQRTLNRVPVKYDLVPFYNDQVDVMPVYLTGQPVLAKMQGYAVNTIDPTDYGVRLYGNVYFTSEMMIRTKPETVRRFVLGLLQGWRDAVANPDEAVKMMVKIEPKLDANQEREFFAATQKYLRFGGDSLGTMSRSRWQETADIMVKYGGLNSDIAIDSVFTNVFVDAAYKEIERNH